jgi:hypothetical protein
MASVGRCARALSGNPNPTGGNPYGTVVAEQEGGNPHACGKIWHEY